MGAHLSRREAPPSACAAAEVPVSASPPVSAPPAAVLPGAPTGWPSVQECRHANAVTPSVAFRRRVSASARQRRARGHSTEAAKPMAVVANQVRAAELARCAPLLLTRAHKLLCTFFLAGPFVTPTQPLPVPCADGMAMLAATAVSSAARTVRLTLDLPLSVGLFPEGPFPRARVRNAWSLTTRDVSPVRVLHASGGGHHVALDVGLPTSWSTRLCGTSRMLSSLPSPTNGRRGNGRDA